MKLQSVEDKMASEQTENRKRSETIAQCTHTIDELKSDKHDAAVLKLKHESMIERLESDLKQS